MRPAPVLFVVKELHNTTHPYRIVESVQTIDGPRTRLTEYCFASETGARRKIMELGSYEACSQAPVKANIRISINDLMAAARACGELEIVAAGNIWVTLVARNAVLDRLHDARILWEIDR